MAPEVPREVPEVPICFMHMLMGRGTRGTHGGTRGTHGGTRGAQFVVMHMLIGRVPEGPKEAPVVPREVPEVPNCCHAHAYWEGYPRNPRRHPRYPGRYPRCPMVVTHMLIGRGTRGTQGGTRGTQGGTRGAQRLSCTCLLGGVPEEPKEAPEVPNGGHAHASGRPSACRPRFGACTLALTLFAPCDAP